MNTSSRDSRLGARSVPPHLIPFATAEEVRQRVAQLGEEVGCWAAEVLATSGRQPLALCLLRGGVFFFSDLLLACPATVEPAFCRCRAYRHNANGVAAAEGVGLRDPDESGIVPRVDETVNSGRC